MSINGHYDVLVIGGGPAGMMAAGTAAARGLRVLLIEKNDVLGRKLSMTGGGRCNITNAEYDVRALLHHYGEAEQFLFAPFAQFSVADTVTFFENEGMALKVEDRKRAFPKSESAQDVTDTMIRFLRKQGVEVLLSTAVEGFVTEQARITGVVTEKGVIRANAYILACGGRSHAHTGSTGEGLSWLEELGHTTHDSNPNLVPLLVEEVWVRKLSGTTLSNVSIQFAQGTQRVKKNGNILITHFGLSGPLILNVAHEVKQLLVHGAVTATIDLFPEEDIGSLRTRFQELYEAHPNKTVENLLKEWFSKKVIEMVLYPFPVEVRRTKGHALLRDVRHQLIERMKHITCTISGTMGYDWAIVSDGGVDLRDIDTRTMQSTVHQNLYLVGDVLHINRPSGGYSLQLCWTTGWVAGNSV
jgi:predicted Rossmann fold flavoprotein